MSALGVHFALNEQEVAALLAREGDGERLEHVQAELEADLFDNHPDLLAETDKAWDAIHRSLTDGTLGSDTGDDLELVVLGGRSLYAGADYIMVLKTAPEVLRVLPRLEAITEATLRAGYDRIDPNDYGAPLDDDDFAYTWDHFQNLRDFWRRAAAAGRSVLFTVDQ